MRTSITRRNFLLRSLAPIVAVLVPPIDGGPIEDAGGEPGDGLPPSEEAASETRRHEQPFDLLMNPFVETAIRRREERHKADTEYRYAVDPQLNLDRFNFVLYGYGDTHEPPLTERAEIGSFTILSYDRRRGIFTKTSLTHDIWAPEIYRYLAARSVPHNGGPIKIYRAFHDGGFELMGQVIEHATGLCADFKIALRDEAIARGIDAVLEYITVEVPFDLDVLPYYLDGKKRGIEYPDNHFRKGSQRFDGARAIQFMKSIPIERPGTYDKSFEHHVRENHVFRAIRASVRDNLRNPLFLPRLVRFWQQEETTGAAHADFDIKSLLSHNLSVIPSVVGSLLLSGLSSIAIPELKREIYIVDAKSGDGGVQWASVNGALFNPIIRGHIRSGRIPNGGRDLEVPLSSTADPDAPDLVKSYWAPVRRRVRELLLAPF